MIGRKRRTAASTIAFPRGRSARDILLDLVYQDHRITDDHAERRDYPELRDKSERSMQDQQRPVLAPATPSEHGEEYQYGPREAVQLQHQQRGGR